MKTNRLIYVIGILSIVGLISFALWREVDRNESQLRTSISGVIDGRPEVLGGLVKTDNGYVLLVDPQTMQVVAVNVINPFLTPMTFHIGQEHALTKSPLQGAYRLLVVTDKNANVENPVNGEITGPLSDPIPLGTEEVRYILDQPFRGLPPELKAAQAPEDPARMIQGKILVAPELQAQVTPNDRVIVMLFDVQQGRPVAMKIIPHFQPEQTFRIGQAEAMGRQPLTGPYSLRIITDKNNQPFESAPGEIVGRSKEPVALGTQDLQFVLDQPYVR